MKKNSLKKNKKGFTIVELVIVIGVIGILSAILIPTFVTLTAKAQDAARKEECASAFSAYIIDAEDGKVGDDGAALAIVSQEEIQLEKDGAKYNYTAADGWHKVDADLSKSGYSLVSPAANLKYNEYTFKYLQKNA